MMSVRHKTYPDSVKHGIPRLGSLQPGWQRFRIGELLEEVRRPVQMNDDDEYDLITVKRSRGGAVKRETLLGREISVKTQFRVEADDFLISKRQIVHGACAVVPASLAGSIVSNEYSVLRCRPEIDIKFLNYLSNSVFFQETCFHSSIGVHIEKMLFKLEEWFDWEIDIPVLEEQKKIVQFLSLVDQCVSMLRKKHSLLCEYNRGVMQKVFSQVVRFRRDNGRQFPEWEISRLGKVATFRKGRGISKENIRIGGSTPCIRYAEIYTHYGEVIDEPISSTVEPKDSLIFSSGGEVIVPASGESAIDIGSFACVLRSGVAIGGDLNIIRAQGIDGSYLARYLSNRRRIDVARLAQGISVVHLYSEQLKEVVVELPHLEEQKKISSFLGVLDAKEKAVAAQIESLEKFRNGILQKIFV